MTDRVSTESVGKQNAEFLALVTQYREGSMTLTELRKRWKDYPEVNPAWAAECVRMAR